MKESREVTTGEKVSYILYTLVVIMAHAIGLAIVVKMITKPAIILFVGYFSDYSPSIFKMAFVLFGFILSIFLIVQFSKAIYRKIYTIFGIASTKLYKVPIGNRYIIMGPEQYNKYIKKLKEKGNNGEKEITKEKAKL